MRLYPAVASWSGRIVYGINQTYHYEDRAGVNQQWRAFVNTVAQIPLGQSLDHYGVYWNCPGNRRFDFLTGRPLAGGETLPPDWASVDLPAGRYAVFSHHVTNIPLCELLDSIWNDWAKSACWKVIKGAPSFERHVGGYRLDGTGSTEVWIPVDLDPLAVVRGDITTLNVAAIVNAANERMLGGGGVDGAIHRAAGPQLLEACRQVPEVAPGVRCPTGQVRLTDAFQLPARKIIHTVGPVWNGGDRGEPDLLAACYRNALKTAGDHGLESIAFPAISCGIYGYPVEKAARIAVRTIRQYMAEFSVPSQVYLVAFDQTMERVLADAVAEL